MSIVDDDPFFVELYSSRLNEIGVSNIYVYHDGESFLNDKDTRSDVVVLDHNLKTLSGLEVLKQMRARGSAEYVIGLSAESDLVLASEYIFAGADEFVLKGFDEWEQLQVILEDVFSGDVNLSYGFEA